MNRQGWLPFQNIGNTRLLAAGFLFLSSIGGTAATRAQSPTAPQFKGPDIAGMLQRAMNEKVKLSQYEKKKAKGVYELGWDLRDCNRNDYNYRHDIRDTSGACDSAAAGLEGALGVASDAVELAYLRACAFPHHYNADKTCADLGSLYEKRGDYATALAVFLHAPHCEKPGQEYFDQKQCLDGADRVAGKMGNKQLQAAIVKQLCDYFSDPYACERLNEEFGGSADVAAAFKRYTAIMGTGPLLGTRPAEDEEDDQPRQQAQGDKWDAAISALQSMPSASDPNAIINAANRQAAGIHAIGDANAARQQQAVQARLAAQQNSARPAAPASSDDAWNAILHTQPSAGNSPSANGAGVAPNSSSSTNNAANYAAPLSSSCIRQFWDPNYYNWLSFQNTCGQAVRVSFIAANPSDTYGMSAKDLAAGQSDNTGWSQSDVNKKGGFALYVCPAGYLPVDSSTDQPISRANQSFSCKQR